MFATALAGDKDFLGRDGAGRAAGAAPRPPARADGWCPSSPTTPTRCSGAASCVLRDGEPVGQVTSAAYGATVGASVGLAYLRRDEPVTAAWLAEGGYEVDLAGVRIPVTATLKAPL